MGGEASRFKGHTQKLKQKKISAHSIFILFQNTRDQEKMPKVILEQQQKVESHHMILEPEWHGKSSITALQGRLGGSGG